MPSILETFEALHPTSKSMAKRAASVFPSGVTHDARAFEPFPIYVDRAAGGRKWDVDGNEIVDYIGGHGALLLGHNRPEVLDAVRGALARGTHFGSSHDLEIAWGEQVLKMVPCGERVRFTSSGTEATMMALRLARAYTGRDRIVTLEDHFHGWHDLVVGRLGPDDAHPHSIGVPDGFYDALTIVPQGDVDALAEALSGRDVAAVILEPTGAHWGTEPLPASYLHEVRRITREAGTLMVMDEVITGFRMAPGGAQEHAGVMPDLSTHAKILAGGLPGGCVTGTSEIVSMLEMREGDPDWNSKRRVSHQGTFNANPASAAAGLAALQIIEDGEPNRQADATAAGIVRGLNDLFRAESVPGSAWAVSSMWHFNLGADSPAPTGVEWDAEVAPTGVATGLMRPLRWTLFNHGVDLMGNGGMVSSAHGEAEIADTIEAFRAAVGDLRAEGLLS
ncbi:MAG: aminotransferase class III-fold pyridoxal phosphate-dependent enzyme [Chloroflexi bacterium]|nr:aminotransferase class III-fold pyridoxal phosphate-dependent enzyme [Chloroflexota bacterium]MDA1147281.1 aminotransferase class III-fold pyridoxal phosphate-dependent enzyme [Chloroflexota bacterium]